MSNSKQIIDNLTWKQAITICGLMHNALAVSDGEFGLLFESAKYQFALTKNEYLEEIKGLSQVFFDGLMQEDDELQFVLSSLVWENRSAIEFKGYNVGE